jgi:hypothetical protein
MSLTSLLYVSKGMHHIGGPSCPRLLLGESQRRLEVREIPLDYVAAAEAAT